MREFKNISLKQYNSFGFDVSADRLIEFGSVDDLRVIFDELHQSQSVWAILSGGNNILFAGDYHGTLLHPVCRAIEIVNQDDTSLDVRVEAGVEWDDFVEWCVGEELWGAENLSLIPGYVGAAPVQNIGAYGVEAKDIISSVEMYCVDGGTIMTLSNEFCQFGYRESVFKHLLKGRVVIMAVNFRLSKIASPKLGYGDLNSAVDALGGMTLRNIRSSVISIRESKLPDPKIMGNAGSFFKNPVVSVEFAEQLKQSHPSMPIYPSGEEHTRKLASGWLIDAAGWKGYIRAQVGVHERQALVLVNRGGATGGQILELAADIQRDIETKFGVKINMEVNTL